MQEVKHSPEQATIILQQKEELHKRDTRIQVNTLRSKWVVALA
jgi:hypothetical protein